MRKIRTGGIKAFAEDYDHAKKRLEYTRKELIKALKEHPKFDSCEEYLDTLEFKNDGVVMSITYWTGPDERERRNLFYNYEEWPVLDLPF